jgi:hypothetical protein
VAGLRGRVSVAVLATVGYVYAPSEPGQLALAADGYTAIFNGYRVVAGGQGGPRGSFGLLTLALGCCGSPSWRREGLRERVIACAIGVALCMLGRGGHDVRH